MPSHTVAKNQKEGVAGGSKEREQQNCSRVPISLLHSFHQLSPSPPLPASSSSSLRIQSAPETGGLDGTNRIMRREMRSANTALL